MSTRKNDDIKANIRKISAADDDELAADFAEGGACTHAFLEAIQKLSGPDSRPTFMDIVRYMNQKMMQGNLRQSPLLSYSHEDFDPTDEIFRVVKNKRGRKFAVIIGINYTQSGYPKLILEGSHKDALLIRDYIMREGFSEEDISLLLDDGVCMEPTGGNIYAAFVKVIEESQRGDSVFVHFSGHISQLPDEDGDELDGLDEVLIASDVDNSILDDHFYESVICGFKEGVTVTSLVDACHSGSSFDLPYQKKISKS